MAKYHEDILCIIGRAKRGLSIGPSAELQVLHNESER